MNLGNLILATHAEAGAPAAAALQREALALDPTDPRARFNLACLLHRAFASGAIERQVRPGRKNRLTARPFGTPWLG